MTTTRTRSKIVVGVDGSPASRQALSWAARQAELTGAQLHAVTSWSMPTTYGRLPVIVDGDLASKTADVALQHAVHETLGAAQATHVRQHVIEGHPAPVLLAAATGADLLVVGSRGHGAFAGLLLGSVAHHVVTHASCPVVVVHASASEAAHPQG